ncbi:MAG: rod shape-determining protein MreD [Clostridia bacterium]|nr:rod shape-determining protein MreD [Clostridia bacterium]
MVYLLNILMFVACFLLDTTKIVDIISIFGIMPQFVFVLLLCFCIYYSKEKSLVLAVIVGLVTDIVTASPIGAYAVLFLGASVLCSVTYENIIERSLPSALAVIFVISSILNIITYIFQIFMGKDFAFMYCLWRYILPTGVYNVIITPALYWLVGKVYYRNERIF